MQKIFNPRCIYIYIVNKVEMGSRKLVIHPKGKYSLAFMSWNNHLCKEDWGIRVDQIQNLK